MNFNEIEEDVLQTGNLLFDEFSFSKYDIIYKHTNEYLKKLFNHFDFNSKDVLTVLASSDQLFNVLAKGTKNVDTFDINKLTKYFYYLRKWNIIYNKKYYLPEDLRGSFIHDLLDKVNVKTEKEKNAYCFWDKLTRTYPSFLVKRLFFNSSRVHKDNYCDVNDIYDKIINYNLDFKQMDISDEINASKKYDYIITSNISEYFPDNYDRLVRYRDNLYKLLKDDGKVISSHLINNFVPYSERKVFKDKFDLYDLPMYLDSYSHNYYTSGYCYTKKDVNKK